MKVLQNAVKSLWGILRKILSDFYLKTFPNLVSSAESISDPISGNLDSFILLTQRNEIYSIFVLSVK